MKEWGTPPLLHKRLAHTRRDAPLLLTASTWPSLTTDSILSTHDGRDNARRLSHDPLPDCEAETTHAVRDGLDGRIEYTEAACSVCGSTARIATAVQPRRDGLDVALRDH